MCALILPCYKDQGFEAEAKSEDGTPITIQVAVLSIRHDRVVFAVNAPPSVKIRRADLPPPPDNRPPRPPHRRPWR
ncbi:MAG TPA: hypothetical protein VHX65_16855 [Pirellulales bacterium]|jgi:hypothetical protein|nr:hypothetical protein [Pirellulales bacterium]